jgi:hypothetical protein
MMTRVSLSVLLVVSGCLWLGLVPAVVWGYAGGPVVQVTDASTFCAACHSITNAAYLPELPADRAEEQLYQNKHYKTIETGDKGYKLLAESDRKALLEMVKAIDGNATVSLEAPTSVAPGGKIAVTVNVRGGIGPVIGVMLVDNALRLQARPISATGWYVTEAPKIIGPDGDTQTWWLEKRVDKKQNLSFVLINNVSADPKAGKYPTAKVTYSLRAPMEPGDYTIAAAFLYGTEEASESKDKQPPGGTLGPSGRIQFSNVAKVSVK